LIRDGDDFHVWGAHAPRVQFSAPSRKTILHV
jgi:hypothetical protein